MSFVEILCGDVGQISVQFLRWNNESGVVVGKKMRHQKVGMKRKQTSKRKSPFGFWWSRILS